MTGTFNVEGLHSFVACPRHNAQPSSANVKTFMSFPYWCLLHHSSPWVLDGQRCQKSDSRPASSCDVKAFSEKDADSRRAHDNMPFQPKAGLERCPVLNANGMLWLRLPIKARFWHS